MWRGAMANVGVPSTRNCNAELIHDGVGAASRQFPNDADADSNFTPQLCP
jgi:hypothetical protein